MTRQLKPYIGLYFIKFKILKNDDYKIKSRNILQKEETSEVKKKDE